MPSDDFLIDAIQFATVVRNIVGNAIGYVPRNGAALVELGLDSDGRALTIIDDGVGISADELSIIF